MRSIATAMNEEGVRPAPRRTAELLPRDADALINAADAMMALGRARDALPLYQRALQIEPLRVDARNNQGNAFLALGQYDAAVGCYRGALDLRPEDAQIHCNLGNAQRLLGRLNEAIAASRRAIALDPTLSVAHNILGLSLAACGQRVPAVASYRQALALDPQYVDALNNLGNVLRDLGLPREALPLYVRAIELEPGRPESHCNLGNVLFAIRQIDAAVASFQRALKLRPDDAPANVSLATALRRQGRAADAEARCLAALAINPAYADALSLLGELRADRGRFSEAEELFQRAISVDASFSAAYCGIAAHRKMTRADAAWRQGVESLLAKRPPRGQEVGLRYALGKYCDDVGRYDEAFEHYRQANELTKRCGSPYDGAKLTRLVDDIIGRFNAAFLHECRHLGCHSELPVFIVGMPRSGTSLTEQIFASHPAIFGAGELTFWAGAFATYQKAELDGRAAGTAAAANRIPGIACDYLDRLTALSGGASRVVDKMPANFMYAGLIHAALPKARVIHMQRQPIDTCLSIYFQNFVHMGPYANDLGNLAHYYGEYLRIMDHWRAVLPATALLEIPYEALINDQEGWTRRMLDFVGLPWDPKCLDFHRTDRAVITASKWQVRQRIDASSVGRWRNYERFVEPLRHLVGLGASTQ
jgi:tetratricopeptide (TPR) repeat protein